MSQAKPDQVLDTSGKCCPMPMVETNQAIRKMAGGSVLEIIATDPGTRADLTSWCERKGHQLLSTSEVGSAVSYLVRKAG